VELLEDVTLAYLAEVGRRAAAHAATRGEPKVAPEDVMFVVRKVGVGEGPVQGPG
jgi:hypothetical protein